MLLQQQQSSPALNSLSFVQKFLQATDPTANLRIWRTSDKQPEFCSTNWKKQTENPSLKFQHALSHKQKEKAQYFGWDSDKRVKRTVLYVFQLG